MSISDADAERGLYAKYRVQKIIRGTDQRGEETQTYLDYPGQCFVLAEHDPIAVMALLEYARYCDLTHPQLAKDLRAMAHEWMDNDPA